MERSAVKKRLVVALVCLVVVGAVVAGIGYAAGWFNAPGSSSPTEISTTSAPASEAGSSTSDTITVDVSVDSSRAASQGWPESMASMSVTLEQGSSAYDALCATGLSLAGSSSYVTSINGLAEQAYGSGSGWFYFVDGASPETGCDSYILQGGESITWVYTLDMGNDL